MRRGRGRAEEDSLHRSLFAQQRSLGGCSGTRARGQQNKTQPGAEGSTARLTEFSGITVFCGSPLLSAQAGAGLLPRSPSPASWPALALCRSRASDPHPSGSHQDFIRWQFLLLFSPPEILPTGHFSRGPHSTVQVSHCNSFFQALAFEHPHPMSSAPTASPAPGGRCANRASLALTCGHSGSGQAGATPRGTRSSRRT